MLSGLGGFGRFILVVLAQVAAAGVNVGMYLAAFRVLTPKGVPTRKLLPGAVVGGISWTVLQILGTYLVHHFMHSASAYGVFATVLALLAWINLAVQMTVYSAEINVVLTRRMWPRIHSAAAAHRGRPGQHGPAGAAEPAARRAAHRGVLQRSRSWRRPRRTGRRRPQARSRRPPRLRFLSSAAARKPPTTEADGAARAGRPGRRTTLPAAQARTGRWPTAPWQLPAYARGPDRDRAAAGERSGLPGLAEAAGGQPDADPGAAAGPGLQGGLPAVRGGDRLHDRQAKTAAAAVAAVALAAAARAGRRRGTRAAVGPVRAAVEPVEGPGGVLGRHAGPGVGDLEQHAAGQLAEPDRDRGGRPACARARCRAGWPAPAGSAARRRRRPAAAGPRRRTGRSGSTATASATASRTTPARSVSVRSSEEVRSSLASSSSSATSVLIRCASCSIRRIAFGSWSGPSAPCRYSSA